MPEPLVDPVREGPHPDFIVAIFLDAGPGWRRHLDEGKGAGSFRIALQQAFHAASEQIYAAAQAKAQAEGSDNGADASSSEAEEEVVDAEVVDGDDK